MVIVVIIILLIAIIVLVAYNFHIQKKIEAYNNINQKISNLSVLQDFMKVAGEEDSVDAKLNSKQDTLVSGTNIKTINGQSILGSGNITIEGTSESKPATYDTIGGILATDSGDNTDKSAYVDVELDGKAFVKIPSVDETSTADDVVNLLNTGSIVLNGNF